VRNRFGNEVGFEVDEQEAQIREKWGLISPLLSDNQEIEEFRGSILRFIAENGLIPP